MQTQKQVQVIRTHKGSNHIQRHERRQDRKQNKTHMATETMNNVEQKQNR